MEWIRENGLALLIIVALAASIVLGRVDSERGLDQQRQDNITICKIGNERGALTASYQRATADARRSSGDLEVATQYDAYARGSEENLAIAPYIDHPQDATQVRLVDTEDGLVYRLNPDAKELIAEGCEKALRD